MSGVALDLKDASALEAACKAMADRFQGPDTAFVLQAQKPVGREVIMGVKAQEGLKPLVMFGLGGIFVEALRDVSFRVAPLTRLDAEAMIDEIRGRRVLEGLRGQPPVDRDALVDAILKVSDLASACREEIEELDINPLVVFPQGARAVDALITRGPAKLS